MTHDSEELAAALGDVVDDYLERRAAGERPKVSEYAERHPEIADLIRRSLRALEVVGDTVASADQSSREGSLEAPKTLGDFRILGELGRGGMGIVYEAEQISMGRKVALKVLPLAALAQSHAVLRFHNEVRAVATLDHPNIVPVYSVGEERGVHYYAMRLIRGQSLAAVIRELSQLQHRNQKAETGDATIQTTSGSESFGASSDGKNPVRSPEQSIPHEPESQSPISAIQESGPGSLKYFRSAASLGIQAAEALQHAHDHGVLHRDIKPGNCMLDSSGRLCVTDFGLARIESDSGMTMTGDIVGTLRYMSPEQASGTRVVIDHRSDVYSLGITLYELFALEPPFAGVSRQALLRQIAEDDPRKLRKINRSVPAELETIVLKAIEKDPDRRYSSAAELADDLRAFLEDRSIKAKPPTLVQQVAKWTRRHSTLVRTAATTLAIALIVGGVLLSRERSQTLAAFGRETEQRQAAERQQSIAESERHRARQLLYVSDMKLASDSLRAGDVPRVVGLLDRHRPAAGEQDLRDFAWKYLHNAVTVRRKWALTVDGAVDGMAVSPNGEYCCAAQSNGQIPIYRVSSGELLQTLVSRTANRAVDWHPSGQRIASVGLDGYVRVWEVDVDSPGQPSDLVVGQATSPENAIVEQSVPILSFKAHSGPANTVCFTPDGKMIVSGGEDSLIHAWDGQSGTEMAVFQGHQRAVNQVAVSPDGTRVASASSDGVLALWETANGVYVRNWVPSNHPIWTSIQFSPDGTLLASGDTRGSLLVADIGTGNSTSIQQRDGIESLCFYGNSHRIVTGDRGGAIRLSNVSRDREGQLQLSSATTSQWQSHSGRVQALAIVSSTNAILSASRDGGIASWSPRPKRARWICSSGEHFAANNEGDLWTVTQAAYQYNLEDRLLTSKMDLNLGSWIQCLAWAPKCQRLAVAELDGVVSVFDLKFRKRIARWEMEHEPHRIAISPNGEQVAVADWDLRQYVDLFDVADPSQHRRFEARQCNCVSFSPDGRSLAVGAMDDLLIYDLDTDGPPRRFAAHDSSLTDVSYSPDGKKVATVGDDRRLKIWDAATAVQLESTEAHSALVNCVQFSDDGMRIVTGSNDKTIRVWNASPLQPMLEFETTSAVEQVALVDDERLFARLYSREILVFDTGPPPEQVKSPETGSSPVETMTISSLNGLGQIPEARDYVVTDLSSDGRLVIGNFRNAADEFRSFRWTPEDGMVVLPLPEGYLRSYAEKISASGDRIMGRFYKSINTAHVGIWPRNGDPPEIGSLSEGIQYINATDMDGSRFAGGLRESSQTSLGFYFDGTKFIKLNDVGEGRHSIVRSISDDGGILTGNSWLGIRNSLSIRSRNMRPVQWRGGTASFLPGFDEGPFNWHALKASVDGSVIVGYQWPEGSPPSQSSAFRWEGGQVQMLRGRAAEQQSSLPRDLSADGRRIVGSINEGEATLAFVWDSVHRLRPLKNDLLRYRVELDDWQLESAGAISPDGTHIAGEGIDPFGRPQPFLATLPRETLRSSESKGD